jgi:hypothetical protein
MQSESQVLNKEHKCGRTIQPNVILNLRTTWVFVIVIVAAIVVVLIKSATHPPTYHHYPKNSQHPPTHPPTYLLRRPRPELKRLGLVLGHPSPFCIHDAEVELRVGV